MKLKNNTKEKSVLKKIESRANYLIKHNYNKYIHTNYNLNLIENIMSNSRCHIVAIFKDNLINDDVYEYLRRFYKYYETKSRINKLCYYHIQTSVIFPNYFPLIESKYLYRSVVKKQRIIDEQQELEDKYKKRNKKNEKNDNGGDLFTSTVYDEILNGSESVMRIVFGLDKNKYNLKKHVNNKDNNIKNYLIDDSKENNLDINKDSLEIDELINEIDKIEKNITLNNKHKNIVDYNLNNKNIKPKLKLVAKELNENKIQSKNNDLINSITNNSTNVTSSSNNIKTTVNLKIKNNNNNYNFFPNNNNNIATKKLKLNKNLINIIKNSQDKVNYNININEIKASENKNDLTTPYRTLYDLNFILKNPLINNLIKTDVNIKNKNNINLNSKNYNYHFNRKNSITNSNKKLNSLGKEKKIPKIDLGKLDKNNINYNNNILTITNRKKSRNINEIFKGISNTISKSYRKRNKNFIKNIINPTLSLSPLHKKQKNIFRKENNAKFLYNNNNINNNFNNSKSIKTMSCKKDNKSYVSNKNLKINEYNFKKNNFLNINLNNKENKEFNIHKKLKTDF